MKNIALVGNPNSGKSTLFNQLTGLRQKVSNFPGVTVEKKTGSLTLSNGEKVKIIDLPGTYSLFPNSGEEKIVVDILVNSKDTLYPDLIIYVADITQLERHLLFAIQLQQLGFPMLFVANMSDLISEKMDKALLENFLKVPVILISSRTKDNTEELKKWISAFFNDTEKQKTFIYHRPYPFSVKEKEIISQVFENPEEKHLYSHKLIMHHVDWLCTVEENRSTLQKKVKDSGFHNMDSQVNEIMFLYDQFLPVVKKLDVGEKQKNDTPVSRMDAILTHKWIGPVIFFGIMLFVFQSIYAWATYPMDWIETGFSVLSEWFAVRLPEHFLSELFIHGILAGLGGVLVFVPQIALLFLLITMLEESGYMSRAVYMFDNIMQKFGMNGRSIVSLISSGACAIPAIMATRTIQNQKERLITIMVSPLISCSARLPVYAILVGFVVPDVRVWGIFNAPGLVFMGLYVLGIVAVLVSAMVFSKIIKGKESSFLMLELPTYKKPNWGNVWVTTKEKVMSFIREAGKIILIISIILWAMSSYGPSDKMANAKKEATEMAVIQNLGDEETKILISQKQLENSWAGMIGKFLEPAIEPLGYDWKIGIALITSFAAREVFVGTMATIYSIAQDDEGGTLREKMKNEKKRDGIRPMYDVATALSLLVFYVFALQCMSTLAVTKKETGSWKWPVIQFLFMGFLAYAGAWGVYSLFS
ncbi:MAG: ferrous iron transport protein B [Saprospiraceae bacterium]|nr:ferrous iron transport protein B [Saprospiraceae bacterium]MBK8371587.1 ferrous iron transport protein B [Saprospiraceae bacterium]MBK8818962.1 ferrous iron transport protein B [Saprospiraceae bacterium]MBK8853564.1 ferrous iron transport protein B [Saprospiraceae bacterium]MBP6694936.1 ferrous iron transport protein B [Saprospiraceae bacterium]